MYKLYERHIDTNSEGLVISIDHLLGTLPTINLWEESTFGDMKYVSLYDPRISVIETSGDNTLKISFVSEFKGFIQLVAFSLPVNYADEFEKTNQRIDDLIVNQKQLVAKSSWTSMNSYTESQIEELKEADKDFSRKITELETDISLL